jgi:hypothetical protein
MPDYKRVPSRPTMHLLLESFVVLVDDSAVLRVYQVRCDGIQARGWSLEGFGPAATSK